MERTISLVGLGAHVGAEVTTEGKTTPAKLVKYIYAWHPTRCGQGIPKTSGKEGTKTGSSGTRQSKGARVGDPEIATYKEP